MCVCVCVCERERERELLHRDNPPSSSPVLLLVSVDRLCPRGLSHSQWFRYVIASYPDPSHYSERKEWEGLGYEAKVRWCS